MKTKIILHHKLIKSLINEIRDLRKVIKSKDWLIDKYQKEMKRFYGIKCHNKENDTPHKPKPKIE